MRLQGRRQVCKSGGAGMLLSADILPQNTMYSNIRYDEPQKLQVQSVPMVVLAPLPPGSVRDCR